VRQRLRHRCRIETGPNGDLFVVSLSTGTIFEIFRK
jgi:hypothetical protein